jgi:hypothetical protein
MITGGYSAAKRDYVKSAELYDPGTGIFDYRACPYIIPLIY